MRCPDCNKFVGMETLDPEVSDLEVSVDNASGAVVVTAQVRVARACADCGSELKEATFDVSEELAAPLVPGHEHEVEVTGEATPTETGGGRYKKNMVGFSLDYEVRCSKCDLALVGEAHDAMAASHFDEL